MKTDLYKLLGARRNTTPEALKRAYRKASLRYHPDRGGDKETFAAVADAYAVLSDPARRARYDATGEYDLGPDNRKVQVTLVLTECLWVVLTELVKAGKGAGSLDVVGRMREALANTLKQLRQELTSLGSMAVAFGDAGDRFRGKGGDNLLTTVARAWKEQLVRVREQLVTREALLKEAQAALVGYGYDFTPPAPPSAGSFWTGGTMAGHKIFTFK